MRIALAQLNPTIGDVAGNTHLVVQAIETARADRAEVLVCPELSLLGYPPRDLLFRDGVVEACERAVHVVADHARGMTVLVGHPRRCTEGMLPVRNSVSACRDGAVIEVYDKRLLPGYDVFDEDRYFEPGTRPGVVEAGGRRLGLLICEDFFRADDVTADREYGVHPARELVDRGCDLLVSLNATPFVLGKWSRHLKQLRAAATDFGVPIVAVNQVGGNDDLIFDGRSVVVDRDGGLRTLLPGWTADTRTVDLAAARGATASDRVEPMDELFRALVLGVHDYGSKTGNLGALIGLSGGIDSALTAAIAAAALGPERVAGLMMPSRHSSANSITDAQDLAARLGLASCDEASIRTLHACALETLEPTLGNLDGSIADENLQARLRGLLLMAVSNATGRLVLATGNKSELAVGYATMYGDMCGALAVIGDLVKTRVYDLARWINEHPDRCGFERPPIPESTLRKVPSAELRPEQTDQDTLPPYEALDAIIQGHVEAEQPVEEIARTTGLDESLVQRWTRTIDRAQYKRDQAALILKVTGRTFGRGRPMPIAMRWTEPSATLPAGGTRARSAVVRQEK